VTLGLILKSQDNASTGILVNNYALQRINGMSQARTVIRVLGNIANGYQPNKSKYIDDRFKFYTKIFEQGISQIRNNNIELNKY